MEGQPQPNARLWWMLVGQATCVGLLLRLDFTRQLGLNQFDEGIYAGAAAWAFGPRGLGAIDPGLIPYAPPGYPILVGLLSLLGGPSDQPCFLVSALLGALTIPAVAFIARATFGEQAGVAAAWCACCSGPHIAFSRSGLTDASFLFVWSLAWIAGLRFLDRPGWRSAALMGLSVGLTQEFKYNGWLLGGLILLTAATCLPGQPRLFGRLVGRGGLGVVVAAAVVLPWYSFVEAHGGYAGLLAHQRSYLGGWSGWWPHLRDQADQAVALAGPWWLSILGTIAIGVSSTRIGPTRPARSGREVLATCLVAGTVGLALSAAPATTVLLHLLLNAKDPDLRRRFVLVGGGVLFLLTPFYHPYARLWLPFELVHWLALGSLVARLVGPGAIDEGDRLAVGRRGRVVLSVGGVLVMLAWGPGFPLARPGPVDHPALFAPSDSLRRLADEVARQIPRDVTEVRTLVRPSLSYYLGGRIPARPQPGWDALLREPGPGSWALVDSTILGEEQGGPGPLGLGGDGNPAGRSWELVARFEVANSLITTLDLDPSARSGWGGCSVARFWLLRPRSKGTPE